LKQGFFQPFQVLWNSYIVLDIHTWTIRSNLNNNTKSVLMSFPIWTFCMCVPVYEYSYFIPDNSSKLFRFTLFNSFYFYNFFSGAHERNECMIWCPHRTGREDLVQR
jgi:hypothetical protein